TSLCGCSNEYGTLRITVTPGRVSGAFGGGPAVGPAGALSPAAPTPMKRMAGVVTSLTRWTGTDCAAPVEPTNARIASVTGSCMRMTPRPRGALIERPEIAPLLSPL